ADASSLRVGHVSVNAEATAETSEAVYAMAHFGGHDFSCGIGPWKDETAYDTMKADLLERCARRSVADLVRGLDEYFPGGLASLSHLFVDERRRVLSDVIRATLETLGATY